MDTDFLTAKARFVKVLEKCIEYKWITVNEYISLDGIAANFASELSVMKLEKETRDIVGKLLWLKGHYPEIYNNSVEMVFK